MTTPKDRPSPLFVLPVCASLLLAVCDLGDRFWGTSSDSRITSYQVNQLTAAVRDLANKFDGLPKQQAFDALMARQDRFEIAISALQQTTAALRADVDILMHPQNRQPR